MNREKYRQRRPFPLFKTFLVIAEKQYILQMGEIIMKHVKIGVIGLGQRGYSVLKSNLLKMDDVDIVGLCDLYEDRIEQAAEAVKEIRGYTPYCTRSYEEIFGIEGIEAVYVATCWETHVKISIDSMRCGIPVACEVGGAYSLEECYALVQAYEETKTPFAFMENCCFNNSELMATAAVRSGALGRIVHCSGAYGHDLREEVSYGNIRRHYRLNNYLHRNCENYPTHELGPIAKILNINRGNKFLSLVSVASHSFGLEEYIKDKKLYEQDAALKDVSFKQGDVVNTIITCEGGETILLTLDTTLPRSYSRAFTVRGTKGMYEMDTNSFFFDGMKEDFNTCAYYKRCIDNGKEYEERFMPSMWLNMTEEQKKRGHGGMDYFIYRAFVDCIKEGREFPIDVYDAAAWMCITCLSAASIENNGAPQAIPDFTNGAYKMRAPLDVVNLEKTSC